MKQSIAPNFNSKLKSHLFNNCCQNPAYLLPWALLWYSTKPSRAAALAFSGLSGLGLNFDAV